jgi:hypothetical protein
MRTWTTRNGLAKLTLPETFAEPSGKYAPNPEGLVATDEDARLSVSVTSSSRARGATLAGVTEWARQEMTKSNFAAKATRPQEVSVKGNRAMRFECAANVRGEDMLSVATVVETPHVVTVVMVLGPLDTIRAQRDFIDE